MTDMLALAGSVYRKRARDKYNPRDYFTYDITIDGIRYQNPLHRIIAMYAVGQLLAPHDYETHHLNGNSLDNRPSNLAVTSDPAVHKRLELYTRMEKLTNKPIMIRLNDVVYVGDIIRDDSFDVSIAVRWWLEQVVL